MTEVEIYGGGHRTRLRSTLMCSRVPPALVYKGARGRRPALGEGAPRGESSFPCWSRRREGRRRRKEGGAPPSLVQFRLAHGEGCGHLLRPFSPFPYGPLRPNTNSRSSPGLRKIPKSLGTFPKSEYSRPIYRSLHLSHFETPRHVPDLIRDSELPTVHQIT